MEDTIDPLTASPELLSPDIQESVVTFKGVVLFSRYTYDVILSRRLNVYCTEKYTPCGHSHCYYKDLHQVFHCYNN